MTNDIATIDVYLNDPTLTKPVPTSVKTANKIVKFKSGHRKSFDDTTEITWTDSSHFKVFVNPQTTLDFEDIAGYFLNSFPSFDIQVIVSKDGLTDTLMNNKLDFKHDKFQYGQNGVLGLRPLLFYDITK